MVPTLSTKDKEVLFGRGISAENGIYGVGISFTSNGLCWLLNYLNASGKLGSRLSLKLLKDIAKFQPDKERWRELRIVAVRLPVYDTNYYQLAFYLNGSPPKAFLAFPPNFHEIPHTFDVPYLECGPFKIRDDQATRIELSESEAGLLGNGEMVVANGGW